MWRRTTRGRRWPFRTVVLVLLMAGTVSLWSMGQKEPQKPADYDVSLSLGPKDTLIGEVLVPRDLGVGVFISVPRSLPAPGPEKLSTIFGNVQVFGVASPTEPAVPLAVMPAERPLRLKISWGKLKVPQYIGIFDAAKGDNGEWIIIDAVKGGKSASPWDIECVPHLDGGYVILVVKSWPPGDPIIAMGP